MKTLDRSNLLSSENFPPPSFDDVLLVPNYTEVMSRLDPEIRSKMSRDYELSVPIISSPMDTVTESHMAISLGSRGSLGVIHRFMSTSQQMRHIRAVVDSGLSPAFAIGVGSSERDRFSSIFSEFGSSLGWVSIDVANGHSLYMKDMLSFVKDTVGDSVNIMAGNVATGEGYLFLSENGADSVRVGIGGGSICKTRIMTGFGVPTLASVLDCHGYRERHNASASIIADGGVRYPADLVKSIAAGADAVMAGRIFAGTLESPGETIMVNGTQSKVYRGMASKEVQEDRKGGLRPGTCSEGVSTHIALKGKAHYILDEFAGGLRSAMTYAGARNLTEFRACAKFVRMSSSSLDESHAFGTRV